MSQTSLEHFSRRFAQLCLADSWQPADLKRRVKAAWSLQTGKPPSWLKGLANGVANEFSGTPSYRILVARAVRYLTEEHLELVNDWRTGQQQPPELRLSADDNEQWELPEEIQRGLPTLANTRQLADWLGVSIGQLDWFADVRGREALQESGTLRNYRYRWFEKRAGGQRLIESPKPRLKELQRQILHEILDHVPVHATAHAFCAGRSIRTCALPHVQQPAVLRIDLRHFFPSITRPRVSSLFFACGYSNSVARTLAAICTNVVPDVVLKSLRTARGSSTSADRNALRHYANPHLPQGAPTSPALANLIAYRLDVRLSALAARFGLNYTRYADDLTFSGRTAVLNTGSRFRVLALAIVIDEGFHIRHRKTRLTTQAGQQRVCGVVVNNHVNSVRQDYDNLRAILHNCRRFGPVSQNLEQHPQFQAQLLGRIAHISQLNPARGKKLRELFSQIDFGKTNRSQ